MNNLLVSAGTLLDRAEPVLLWTTVGVTALALIVGIAIFFIKKEVFGKYCKYTLFAFLVYALAVGILMLSLQLAKYYGANGKYTGTDVATYVFIPILVTLTAVLIASVTAFVIAKKRPEISKKYNIIAATVCAVTLVAAMIFIAVYFNTNVKGDGYYDGYGKLNGAALYISAVLLVGVSIAAAFFVEKNDKSRFDAKALSLAGISVALSFALSYVKLWRMPQGGSVTLVSMLPIMLFSYVYGAKKGILVGFVYGMLQAVQDPYIIHPAQFLLDYPIAYALTGLAGIFKRVNVFNKLSLLKFAISALVGGTLRFTSHVLSGVFAFGAYALDSGNTNFLLYSAAYNSYIFIDLILVIAVGAILLSSKGFSSEIRKFGGLNDEA